MCFFKIVPNTMGYIVCGGLWCLEKLQVCILKAPFLFLSAPRFDLHPWVLLRIQSVFKLFTAFNKGKAALGLFFPCSSSYHVKAEAAVCLIAVQASQWWAWGRWQLLWLTAVVCNSFYLTVITYIFSFTHLVPLLLVL